MATNGARRIDTTNLLYLAVRFISRARDNIKSSGEVWGALGGPQLLRSSVKNRLGHRLRCEGPISALSRIEDVNQICRHVFGIRKGSAGLVACFFRIPNWGPDCGPSLGLPDRSKEYAS